MSFAVANQIPIPDARWSATLITNGPFWLVAEWLCLPWKLADLEDGIGLLPFSPSYISVSGFNAGSGVQLHGRPTDQRILIEAVRKVAAVSLRAH